ncbi:Hsp20/alpha crystallin family protein [Ornithinimicrobium cavernae]|uniref:Hsp20/alpha crystallin family protein n=1 Tax=Ornithinimicrobium cavernae TaxID=2666047 RepID=UPI001F234ABD|nr:Hsp20/alpha crystallin family protein [Ornithinimicrobium cavernae]
MNTFSTFDPFREIDRVLGSVTRGQAGPGMPMDLYREGDRFVVEVDLPGVDPSTIDIDVDDRSLTIRAERAPRNTEAGQWLTRERPTGTFARQLTLGRGLATDRIDASYADGVLQLVIPVAEEAKPRKIEVAHGGQRTLTAGAGDQEVEQTTGAA